MALALYACDKKCCTHQLPMAAGHCPWIGYTETRWPLRVPAGLNIVNPTMYENSMSVVYEDSRSNGSNIKAVT